MPEQAGDGRQSHSDWQNVEPEDRLRVNYTTTFDNESDLTLDMKEVRTVTTTDREIVESATGVNRDEDREYRLEGSENGLLTVIKLGEDRRSSPTTVGHGGTATIEGTSLSKFSGEADESEGKAEIVKLIALIEEIDHHLNALGGQQMMSVGPTLAEIDDLRDTITERGKNYGLVDEETTTTELRAAAADLNVIIGEGEKVARVSQIRDEIIGQLMIPESEQDGLPSEFHDSLDEAQAGLHDALEAVNHDGE